MLPGGQDPFPPAPAAGFDPQQLPGGDAGFGLRNQLVQTNASPATRPVHLLPITNLYLSQNKAGFVSVHANKRNKKKKPSSVIINEDLGQHRSSFQNKSTCDFQKVSHFHFSGVAH